MKGKTPLSENRRRMHAGSKPRVIAIVGLTLLLITTSTILAWRGNPSGLNLQKSSETPSEVASTTSFSQASPSKEYVYAGGRLVATEEPCNSISPTYRFFTSSGGDGSVNVTGSADCTWTVVSSDIWITLISPPQGTGNGEVDYLVRTNSSSGIRFGTITIGTQVFAIAQGGFHCTYSIAPALQSFPHGGGDGIATVTTDNGCGWISVCSDPWITIVSGSGSGNGTVSYTVASNPTGAARVGTISIANRTLTVKQKP